MFTQSDFPFNLDTIVNFFYLSRNMTLTRLSKLGHQQILKCCFDSTFHIRLLCSHNTIFVERNNWLENGTVKINVFCVIAHKEYCHWFNIIVIFLTGFILYWFVTETQRGQKERRILLHYGRLTSYNQSFGSQIRFVGIGWYISSVLKKIR